MPTESRLTNNHTSCEAMGLALSNGRCYYASGAGNTTSCRSIWASLISNNSGARAPEWWSSRTEFSFAGEKGVKTLWANLPDSHYKHFCMTSPDPNIILLIDPAAAGMSTGEIVPLRLARMDEARHRFYLWTLMHVNIPIKEEWIDFIWDDVAKNAPDCIKQMNVFGDCIGGWRIEPDAGWPGYISTKIKRGQITV